MESTNYIWILVVIAVLCFVCCCAWVTKTTYLCTTRNQDAENPGPNAPRQGTGGTAGPAGPVHRILTVETVYSPPSPGILPDSFEVPPLYSPEFSNNPFNFENETNGVLGLTNMGLEIGEEPPSYDDVIKADIRRPTRNALDTQHSNNNQDSNENSCNHGNHDSCDDTRL